MSNPSGNKPPGEASGEDSNPTGDETSTTKTKSKSKMGAFKSLREASRSGSFRIGGRKKSMDEASIGSSGVEGGSDMDAKKGSGGKKNKKKRQEEESSAGNMSPPSIGKESGNSEGAEETEKSAGEGAGASTTKKKKKKGSSLVRKLSNKYRNKSSSSTPTESAKKEDSVAEETEAALALSEAAAVSLPEEEEEDLLSVGSGASTATGSAGGAPSRASDNPPLPLVASPILSRPTMSSSTSSSSSVNTPPSGTTAPSPETSPAPPGRTSPSLFPPLSAYLPTHAPSFPTTLPLYYKPPQPPSLVNTTRRSATPPYHPSPTASGGSDSSPTRWGNSSPTKWSARPRGPLGASIKSREHEIATTTAAAVVSHSWRGTEINAAANASPAGAGLGGINLASHSSEEKKREGVERKGEVDGSAGGDSVGGSGGVGVSGGERAVSVEVNGSGEKALSAAGSVETPPTASTAAEKSDFEERDASLLHSESEATVEESGKVEVAAEEERREEEKRNEEREKEEKFVAKEEGVEGEGEGGEKVVEADDSEKVRGPSEAATVEESRGESLEEEGGASGGEREGSPPRGMEEAADTTTALASGGGSASGGGGVMVPGGGGKREHLYKILVIGELGTGKTSIIKRYVHQFFSQHYRATIGVDFALKVINWDADTIIRLQLWDIAGQERFGNMTRVYYKEAVGAFIVFDVTRSATFESVVKWKVDLDSKVQLPDGSPIPCVLLANKCDQQKEGVVNNPTKMEEYCKEKGFSGWYETSAKENINIEEAARFLVTKILKNDRLTGMEAAKDSDRFAIGDNGPGVNGNGGRGGSGRQEGKSCAC